MSDTRKAVRWGFAFGLTVIAATTALVLAIRPRPEGPVVPRDPAEVSDVDVEIILTKIREGDLHAMKGDMARARTAWSEGREVGLDLWPVHEGLGDSYARFEMNEDALQEYDRAARLLRNEAPELQRPILYKKAGIEANLGRHEEALKSYLALGEPEALEQVIIELVKESPRQEALLRILDDHASAIDPRVYRTFAVIVGDTPRGAKAVADYVSSLAPWDRNLNQQVCAQLVVHKEIDKAIDVCRAWARAVPRSIEPYLFLGNMLRAAGREDEALVAYTSIVDVRAGDANAHRTLGQVFRDLKKFADAIRQFEQAKTLRPEEPFWDQEIVLTHYESGDVDAAEAALATLRNTKWESRFGSVERTVTRRLAPFYLKQMKEAKKSGDKARALSLRKKLAALGMPEFEFHDIKVIMTWDRAIDVDMDIREPDGTHVYHGHAASKSGGKYHGDILADPGYGPETYTLKKGRAGEYKVGAHLHGDGHTNVKVTILLYEGTDREKTQEFSLVVKKGGEQVWLTKFRISE